MICSRIIQCDRMILLLLIFNPSSFCHCTSFGIPNYISRCAYIFKNHTILGTKCPFVFLNPTSTGLAHIRICPSLVMLNCNTACFLEWCKWIDIQPATLLVFECLSVQVIVFFLVVFSLFYMFYVKVIIVYLFG